LTPVGLTGRRTRLSAPRTFSTNERKPIRRDLLGARALVLWRRWLFRALPFENIHYRPRPGARRENCKPTLVSAQPPTRKSATWFRFELTLPATTSRTGSRKLASPATGLRGIADVGSHPFAGSKSRKQPLDACRHQRPVDRPLLTTSNGHCRPTAELPLACFDARKQPSVLRRPLHDLCHFAVTYGPYISTLLEVFLPSSRTDVR
jgi:hypothetical protein